MLGLEGSRVHLHDIFISQMRKLDELQKIKCSRFELFHYSMLPHLLLEILFQIFAVIAVFAYIGSSIIIFFSGHILFSHTLTFLFPWLDFNLVSVSAKHCNIWLGLSNIGI